MELLPNVHLLTLQALPRGQLLLRLAHLYQVGLRPYGTIFSQSDSMQVFQGAMLHRISTVSKIFFQHIRVVEKVAARYMSKHDHFVAADWRR